jgi:hypothetical protein
MDETAAISVNRPDRVMVSLFILDRFPNHFPSQDTTTGHAPAQGMQGGRVVVGEVDVRRAAPDISRL